MKRLIKAAITGRLDRLQHHMALQMEDHDDSEVSFTLSGWRQVGESMLCNGKAFDSVSSWFLLAELQTFGFTENVLRWIGAFLSRRRFKICVSVALSSSTDATSGALQGSVLSSLLFIMVMNDPRKSSSKERAQWDRWCLRSASRPGSIFGMDSGNRPPNKPSEV